MARPLFHSASRFNFHFSAGAVLRALIVSDIHSNRAALAAVLADAAARGGFDALWCLGDLVGYGPEPGACLELLRRYPLTAVAGNHDHAALYPETAAGFNHNAAAAALWTAGQLSREEQDFLADLPLTATAGAFTLVHGSLRAPLREYLLSPAAAAATFARLTTPYCLVGHSHLPFSCVENRDGPEFVTFAEDELYPLDERRRIINPGSVGQPRDYDCRAAYAVYDDAAGTVEQRRVSYDIADTQDRMRQAGLPPGLIDRLNYGV